MQDYERHPISQLWPDMPKDGKWQLVDDIKEHGLRDPEIVLLDNMVLDGWHRYNAAKKAQRECRFVKFGSVPEHGSNPAMYVLSRNRHRRHLSRIELTRAAVETVAFSERVDPALRAAGITNKEIADAAGVSVSTVKQARQEKAKRDQRTKPEPPPKAAKPKDKRSAIDSALEQVDSDTAKSAAAKPKPPAKPKQPSKLALLQTENEELKQRIKLLTDQAKPEALNRDAELQNAQATIKRLKHEVQTLKTRLKACERGE